MSALSKIYSGDHVTGVRHAEMAQSLSPRDPHIFLVEQVIAFGYFFRRDLETAAAWAESALERQPDHRSALRIALAIFGHLGRTEECARYLQRLKVIAPHDSITALPPLQPDDARFYIEGLHLGGMV